MIHREVVSIGSLSSSYCAPARSLPASGVAGGGQRVLAHNHPSGDASPSQVDIDLTRRLVQAGEIMGIDVLDHLIISADDFLSLKEKDLL